MPTWPSRRTTIVAVVAAGALAVCLPALGTVYRATVTAVVEQPFWLAAATACEAAGIGCGWYVERRLVGARRLSDIAIPHLAANAVSCVAPMGGPTGAAVHLRLLRRRGTPMVHAVSGLGLSGLLGTLTQLVLAPLVLGGAAADNGVLGVGGVVTFVLAATGCWLVLCSPRALDIGVRAANALLDRLPWTASSSTRVPNLRERQAELRRTITARPVATTLALVGRAAGDYLALYVALRAVGADLSPAAVMAVYFAVSAVAAVPLTFGGIGLIEVAMTAALVAAGLEPAAAATAVAIYRCATCWIPVAAGATAFVVGEVSLRPVTVEPEVVLVDDPVLPVLDPALA